VSFKTHHFGRRIFRRQKRSDSPEAALGSPPEAQAKFLSSERPTIERRFFARSSKGHFSKWFFFLLLLLCGRYICGRGEACQRRAV
jgi:hypothetical protein